jgi:hypothetical protein
MFRLCWAAGIILSVLFVFTACNTQVDSQDGPEPLQKSTSNCGLAIQSGPKEDDENITLFFSIGLRPTVYEKSDWGEPPQVAIWLEDPNSQVIKTVFVTDRSGLGVWKGKVSCPVALSYWFSRYNKETNTVGPPTYRKPASHAVTGATPELEITASANIAPKSEWNYFVEVNVAGDFNSDFPSTQKTGMPDPQGNETGFDSVALGS